ncbi:HNH endonuclease signature motif containing protein [Arsenicibacter rosenii]|uniref:HNH nuclease domain-containing protein n=1 Tax=Arsenicibacter rosenii TaxID=1750698 RepID=A0A1S2VM12_9BACT|nr:HNH endonuclease signature motif containing protein [Arsenicibacter rosenii]OIN59789.1 hypothetical protein BLX24_07995 [Arsenicibacter rosenii]
MRANYLLKNNQEMAAELGRSLASVNDLLSARLKLKRPKELVIRFRTRSRKKSDGWSQQELDFLKDNYLHMTNEELTVALGRTKGAVQTCLHKRLRVTRPAGWFSQHHHRFKKQDNIWSQAEIGFVRENIELMTNEEIARELGRTKGGVKSIIRRYNLLRSKEAISRFGKRPNAGHYKKGQLPLNTIYDEGEVVRIRHAKTGAGRQKLPYKYIKLDMGKWQQYHQVIWIRANGPIPDKHIVVFRNGDQMDCRLENLELITLKENAIRNSGSIRLTDGYVAQTMSPRNAALREQLKEFPELIDARRAQLQLKRLIKHDNAEHSED